MIISCEDSMSYIDDRKRNYDIKLKDDKQFEALIDAIKAIAEATDVELPQSTKEVIDFIDKVKTKYPKT